MKKTLVVLALVLAIAMSVVAGTLALYTTSIDDIAEGSVVAKNFVLLENGSDTFVQDVKIAPTESVSWQFSVQNFEGNVITETAMDLDFTVDIAAASGKSAIAPLTVTVKNEAGNMVGSQVGTGTIRFIDTFELAPTGQTHTYTVIVEWPGDNNADTSYAGSNFGNSITVSVTGTQRT